MVTRSIELRGYALRDLVARSRINGGWRVSSKREKDGRVAKPSAPLLSQRRLLLPDGSSDCGGSCRWPGERRRRVR